MSRRPRLLHRATQPLFPHPAKLRLRSCAPLPATISPLLQYNCSTPSLSPPNVIHLCPSRLSHQVTPRIDGSFWLQHLLLCVYFGYLQMVVSSSRPNPFSSPYTLLLTCPCPVWFAVFIPLHLGLVISHLLCFLELLGLCLSYCVCVITLWSSPN